MSFRRPALVWALLHAPVILFLYHNSFVRAALPLPTSYRVTMVFGWIVEAAFLGFLAWLFTLPFSLKPRAYRFIVPAVLALWTATLAVDAQIFDALAFHINGFFVRVLLQPRALDEVGVPISRVVVFLTGAAAWTALDTWIGSRFIAKFASPQRVWTWALGIVLVQGAERLVVAALTFYGGSAVYAAGIVLPLEAPLRINSLMTKLTGRRDTPSGEALSGAPVPTGADHPDLPAGDVHFTRTPDVVLILVESLRSDFFDAITMPKLWARSAQGARFDRHYASASSTHYSLFSLFFGLHSQKLEAVLGSGRKPLLLEAFRKNGYAMHLIMASSVDWMGMTHTVFADVVRDLDTDLPGTGATRDSAMVVRARDWVSHANNTPMVLVLFFDGTHFNYSYPDRSARFSPAWDGKGALEDADSATMKVRARNAAYEIDWKIDEFLTWFAHQRGRSPLVLVTGDHGEAFREQGRVGHGSGVSEQEIHVPMVLLDSLVKPGIYDNITSHVDVLPTLLGLLGDHHPAAAYCDGMVMTASDSSRYALATAGWIPRFAVVGRNAKVSFFGFDAGFGAVDVTDPMDRPLPHGNARIASEAASILRAFSQRR